MSISGSGWCGEGRGASIGQAEQGQGDVALRRSPIHHSANLTEHLQVPGTVLSPAGLDTPQALLSRSWRVGQEDRVPGRWTLLLLMDGQGGEEGWGAGGFCPGDAGEEWRSWVPLWNSLPQPSPQACFSFKSNNFRPQLPPACHVPTQSFSEIWSCG